MNAVTPEQPIAASLLRDADTLAGRLPGAVRAKTVSWSLPLLLTGFWIYVAVSNVLYAKGMSASLDPGGHHGFFAAWQARLLQHVFLYPILAGCIWCSLRIGWTPIKWRVPLQVLLGLFFAALAAPLLWVGEAVIGGGKSDKMWHEHAQHVSWWNDMFGDGLGSWIASITLFTLTYGFALALVWGFSLYRRTKESELRFAALEHAWSEARLAALRMQLSPHALFNLLHSIRGHIAWDPAAAQTMIVQLGDLLRRLLSAGERDFSPLSQELEFAQLYLQLQRSRFADRLSVKLPERTHTRGVWVPSLILQPLIENAVKHGLAQHNEAVSVELRVEQYEETLVLSLLNTTAPDAQEGADGVGLRNVRERLALHFGERARLFSGFVGRGRWLSEIRMPLLLEPAAAERRPAPVHA